jgi:ATP-dependent Clp protease adaptor protein ClpS
VARKPKARARSRRAGSFFVAIADLFARAAEPRRVLLAEFAISTQLSLEWERFASRMPARVRGANLAELRITGIDGMAGKNGSRGDEEGKTGLITKTRPKTKKPSLYKVLLLNDDYTPMEFVVHVLERFFNKGREEATRIMLHVHQKGVGICGVYTYEVAETKVAQVMDFSRQNQHPLQCTMEKE